MEKTTPGCNSQQTRERIESLLINFHCQLWRKCVSSRILLIKTLQKMFLTSSWCGLMSFMNCCFLLFPAFPAHLWWRVEGDTQVKQQQKIKGKTRKYTLILVKGVQYSLLHSITDYKITKSNSSGVFCKFACVCLSCICVCLGCFSSVNRLYSYCKGGYGPSTPRYFLSSFMFLSFSPCIPVFEPLPVTVNLRQPLCWHRWEVNRSKWPILRATLPTPSVSQVRAEY